MSATDPRADDTDREERLRKLPPSAKLVYKVLEYDDALTQGQIAEETLLPARTVRYALSRLEETGLVGSRFSFTDARKRIYSIGGAEYATGAPGGTTDRDSTSGPLPESL